MTKFSRLSVYCNNISALMLTFSKPKWYYIGLSVVKHPKWNMGKGSIVYWQTHPVELVSVKCASEESEAWLCCAKRLGYRYSLDRCLPSSCWAINSLSETARSISASVAVHFSVVSLLLSLTAALQTVHKLLTTIVHAGTGGLLHSASAMKMAH